ncbi:hypothetical protein Vretimale_11705 [Volvox reticuliferus]|uniref:Uncharacterized protein n=1 Tax=Volvox reticuliferus TaxID=1737510 RepID=A0A8J4D5X9_9CHLO|nr:hypothetical protein Vretifemale_20962 [Volvox reticuliferus]GIM07626.1 hypothetical protein Vretimale_11705 [Volvox reticuliferus]
MSLPNKKAAFKRLAELYKGDPDVCPKLMAKLTILRDDIFSNLCAAWESLMDSPAEKAYLELMLSRQELNLYETAAETEEARRSLVESKWCYKLFCELFGSLLNPQRVPPASSQRIVWMMW